MKPTFSQKYYALGSCRSEIRELFEYGKKRASEIGSENVYDFSLGNPSIPAPECVKQAIIKALDADPLSLHGYTSAEGDLAVRRAVAGYIEKTHSHKCSAYDVYMTCGAAVVLGSEGSGISRLVKEKCDFTVSIPLYGSVNSMNVSCAAAVILAEVARQRSVKGR